LGPLAVRFLLAGDDSTGSIAAFELVVPGAKRQHPRIATTSLRRPAMASTECWPGPWTENKLTSGQGKHCAFREVPLTGSITTESKT